MATQVTTDLQNLQAIADANHRKLAALATAPGYSADGSVASFVFYSKWTCNITSGPANGKRFSGQAGGIGLPGGGAIFGTVYSDDVMRLVSSTHSFQWTAAAFTYTSLIFFDSDSNFLGSFQAGGLSTVNGTGGGTGSWS